MTDDPAAARLLHRIAWAPWLAFDLSPGDRALVDAWQREVQARWEDAPGVTLAPGCVIAPDVHLFAAPGRAIAIGRGAAIASGAVIHGPVAVGERVYVHPRVTLEGGRAGVTVGAGTRIANGATVFAYDYGLDPTAAIMDQPVDSRGVHIGADVWIGAGAGVTDGVTVGDHAVVGMGAVVTRDVADWAIVAGSPARVIGDRRDR